MKQFENISQLFLKPLNFFWWQEKMTRHYFFCGETCHDLAQNLIFKTNILLCETSCWDRRCVLTEKTRINLFFPRIFKFLSYLGTTQLSKFRDVFRNIFYKTIYRETFSVSVLLLTLTPLLKLCLNKKGQTFVGMLIFWNLSFGFQSAAFCKKRFKNRASQQRFGSFYFVRTLVN